MSKRSPFAARFRANGTSVLVPADLYLNVDGSLWIKPVGLKGWKVAAEDIKISSPDAPGLPILTLRGGAMIEPKSAADVEIWRKHHSGGRGSNWLTQGQRNTAIVLATLAILVGSLWGTYRYAIPAASAPIAKALPTEIGDAMSQASLDDLERNTLSPSGLNRSDQSRLRALLIDLEPPVPIDLQFRRMDGVANAFALPDGTVIMTDALAKSMSSDELQAVLAHEIAHVVEQHGLQTVIQSAALPILIAFVTGDFSFMLEPSGALTLLLASSGYSRAMEADADAYAVTMLAERGLDPWAMAAALRRLQELAPTDSGSGWFSSHPDTSARIEDVEAMARSLR